ALMLVTAAGLSYEEASRICGCAIGTIKSRVNRARARLIKVMDGEPTDPMETPIIRPPEPRAFRE
ncbi:MAG: sigma factor-like helix-turn-helix DNA-binding protein, partial [Caulobacteraceae bacterium]